jgi:hypothetical protein
MIYRQLNVAPRNRAAALALVVTAIAVGGMIFALGLSLLLGILALAAVGGAGVTLYRRIAGVLRGERPWRAGERGRALDPALEVFPGRIDARSLNQPNRD